MTKEDIGKYLQKERNKRGISKYSIVKGKKHTFSQLTAIETGATNYTIDSLLNYLKLTNIELPLK